MKENYSMANFKDRVEAEYEAIEIPAICTVFKNIKG